MWPWLNWFFRGIESHFDPLHAIMFLGILVLGVRTVFKSYRFPKNGLYQNPAGLFFLGTFSLLFLIAKSQSNINIINFALGSCVLYGLLSFIVDNRVWSRGLLPFMLLLMTLPFGRHLDLLLGYPLRMFAAGLSFELLSPFLPDLTSTSSILMIENRASHVDMDCSGLRGLWVSIIFFLFVSWIENTKTNLKWLVALLSATGIIIVGNIIRIILLATIQLQASLQFLDPFVHHSTSIFFLLVSCLVSFSIIRKNKNHKPASTTSSNQKTTSRYANAVVLTVVLVIGFVPNYTPTLPKSFENEQVRLSIEELGWIKDELTDAEARNFRREGVEAVKYRLNDIQLVLVLGGDWRTQHVPEMCYDLAGMILESTTTVFADTEFPVKRLAFKDRPEKAYYWFQHSTGVTDDYASKFWKQLYHHDEKWTQVSLLCSNGDLPKQKIIQLKQILTSHQ